MGLARCFGSIGRESVHHKKWLQSTACRCLCHVLWKSLKLTLSLCSFYLFLQSQHQKLALSQSPSCQCLKCFLILLSFRVRPCTTTNHHLLNSGYPVISFHPFHHKPSPVSRLQGEVSFYPQHPTHRTASMVFYWPCNKVYSSPSQFILILISLLIELSFNSLTHIASPDVRSKSDSRLETT